MVYIVMANLYLTDKKRGTTPYPSQKYDRGGAGERRYMAAREEVECRAWPAHRRSIDS